MFKTIPCVLFVLVISLFNIELRASESERLLELDKLVTMCKSSHKNGMESLYKFIEDKPELQSLLKWYPSTDLELDAYEVDHLNGKIQSLIDFSPILGSTLASALGAKYAAPLILRKPEEDLKKLVPALSYYILLKAVEAVQFLSYRMFKADRRNGKGFGNGLQDARRHIVWSASLSRTLGSQMAFCILGLHEIEGDMKTTNGFIRSFKNPVSDLSTHMDFFNNSIGVMIGRNFQGTKKELVTHLEELLEQGAFVVVDDENGLVPSSSWLN